MPRTPIDERIVDWYFKQEEGVEAGQWFMISGLVYIDPHIKGFHPDGKESYWNLKVNTGLEISPGARVKDIVVNASPCSIYLPNSVNHHGWGVEGIEPKIRGDNDVFINIQIKFDGDAINIRAFQISLMVPKASIESFKKKQ